MIRNDRAAGATLLPVWAEHEMIDEQLTASVEEIPEGHLTVRPIEDVFLFNFYPWQLAAPCAQLILESRDFFFLSEELFARLDPLVS
jgi:hypothetical protein